MYAQVNEDDFMLPAIPYQRIPPQFLRQEVDYQTVEKPGTVVVDTKSHFLYFVEPGGKAMRYGVGLGREGYAWSGRGVIQWKTKWPRWTPPAEMVSREPDMRPLSAERGGMNPGPTNPLGARAMYIYKNGKDTLYRIHGTPDWQSDRQGDVVGLRADAEPGRHRPLQSRVRKGGSRRSLSITIFRDVADAR